MVVSDPATTAVHVDMPISIWIQLTSGFVLRESLSYSMSPEVLIEIDVFGLGQPEVFRTWLSVIQGSYSADLK